MMTRWISQEQVRQPAGVVIVPGHRVAVDENYGAAVTPIAVMKADAVSFQEGTLRRVPPFGSTCHEVIAHCQGGQGGCAGSQDLADRTGLRPKVRFILSLDRMRRRHSRFWTAYAAAQRPVVTQRDGGR